MIISIWDGSTNEKNQILSLVKNIYKGFRASPDSHFEWMYRNNPYGQGIILLAKDEKKNNSIIGVEPIIPLNLLVDGQTVKGSLSLGSAVDVDYRGQGIFSKLVSKLSKVSLNNNIVCIYGVPNDQSFKIFINNDFRHLGKLPLLVKPLRFSKYFKQPLSTILSPFDVVWKVHNNNNQVTQLSESFDQEFVNLVSKASKRIRVLQKRDKEYLQWRYVNHPSHKYRIFILKEKSVLKGYIITRKTKINGKPVGVILDFLVDAEIKNKEKLKDLIRFALIDLWNQGVSVVIATCGKNMLENELLRQTGFFSIPDSFKPEPLYFIINNFNSKNENAKKLIIPDNWFFSFGDYDAF